MFSPISIADHRVQGRVREVVTLSDTSFAVMTVVDHAIGRVGPELENRIEELLVLEVGRQIVRGPDNLGTVRFQFTNKFLRLPIVVTHNFDEVQVEDVDKTKIWLRAELEFRGVGQHTYAAANTATQVPDVFMRVSGIRDGRFALNN